MKSGKFLVQDSHDGGKTWQDSYFLDDKTENPFLDEKSCRIAYRTKSVSNPEIPVRMIEVVVIKQHNPPKFD